MIYYFKDRDKSISEKDFIEEKEVNVNPSEKKDDNQSKIDNPEGVLKAYYTCADEIFNRREVKVEVLLSAFRRLLEHLQTFVDTIWGGPKEEEPNQLSTDDRIFNLYYLAYGNICMRKAQMEAEIYDFNISLFNQARNCFQKVEERVKQKAKEKERYLSLLACFNRIKCERDIEKYYFRYHGDEHLVFNTIHNYKELLKRIEPGTTLENFNDHASYVTDLDVLKYGVVINIGRCHQNRNKFAEAQNIYDLVLSLKDIWIDQKLKEKWDTLPEKDGDSSKYTNFKNIQEQSRKIDTNCNKGSHLIQTLVNKLICEIEINGKNGNAGEIAFFILDIDSQNIDVRNNLGVILRKNKEYSCAIETFNGVVNLLHKDSTANKGDTSLGDSSIDISADKFCSKDRFALLGIVKCLIKQKKYVTAKLEIDKIKEYYPYDKEILLWEAMWYRNQEKFQDAVFLLKKILEDCPAIAPGTLGLKATYVMGTCYLGWGYPSQAKKCFERITTKLGKKKDVLAQMDLGWSKQVLGEEKGALAEYNDILCEKGNQGKSLEEDIRLSVLNNTGECYLYQENYVAAIEKFIEILQKQRNARAYCLLAHCLRKKKDKEEKEQQEEQQKRAIMSRVIATLDEKLQNLFKVSFKEKKEHISVNEDFLAAYFAALAKEMSPCDPDVDSEYILCLNQARQKKHSDILEKFYQKQLQAFLQDPYGQNELCIEALIALYEYGKPIESAQAEAEKENFYKHYIRFLPMKRGACAEQLYQLLLCEAYKGLDPEIQGQIAYQVYCMQRAMNNIKHLRRIKKEEASVSYVHYTRINALKALLSTTSQIPPRFRLSNIAYMNDPSEGDSFGALLYSIATSPKERSTNYESANAGQGEYVHVENKREEMEEKKKLLSDFNLLDNHVCEIGFLGDRNVYTTSLSSQRDSIYMWGIYADNGKGCCVQFDEDFFQLRESYPESFIPYYMESNSYPLYRMCYLQQKQGEKEGTLLKSEDHDIKEFLEEIIQALEEIHKLLKNKEDDVRKTIYGRVMSILDQVRYLFKYQEYEQEQEYRSFIVTKNCKLDEKPDKIPMLYTEIDKDIRFEEVCLGPNVQNGEQIEAWLYATHRVNKVTRSTRHYR